MKIVYGVFLLAMLIALAQAFPGAFLDSAESTEIEDDSSKKAGVVVIVPPRRNIFDEFQDEDDDDVDVSMPSFWNPFRFNKKYFEDIITNIEETMKRFNTETVKSSFNSWFGQDGLTPWNKIPEGANTTSTTKIVDNHSITVNETIYKNGDENSGTILRVRVINVKPLNDTSETVIVGSTAGNNENSSEEKQEQPLPTKHTPTTIDDNGRREELTTTATRSVETVEEFDNEIYNNKNQVETLIA